MASMPPYKSEEYQLRKYKGTVPPGSTSVQGGDGDDVHPDLKREQEQRNPWEHDVEAPVLSDTTRQFRAGIDAGWQKMRD